MPLNNEIYSFGKYKKGSTLIENAMNEINGLIQSPMLVNSDVLYPIAKQLFQDKYKYEPQPITIAEQDIDKSPKEKIEAMLSSPQIKFRKEYLQEMNKLTDADQSQWRRLANTIEHQEIGKITNKLQTTIKKMMQQNEDNFIAIKGMTTFVLGCILQEDCSIIKIEIEKERHFIEPSDPLETITNVRDLLGVVTSTATKLIAPSINITTQVSNGKIFTIKITDEYKFNEINKSNKYQPDEEISIENELPEVLTKIGNIIQARSKEKESQQEQGFSR